MASALLIQQCYGGFASLYLTNRSLTCCQLAASSVFINPLRTSLSSTFSSEKVTRNLKLIPVVRASSEGIPAELVEDSKFVPLNAEDGGYGPPALLLMGFDIQETAKIQQFLKELDGEFMKIVHCTEDMITCSLWDAMNTEQQNWENLKIVKSLPRICFLSGLTGEEMMMFIDAFPETGLEPAVFAALVPNSADKLLEEVIEEIIGDHEMMSARTSEPT